MARDRGSGSVRTELIATMGVFVLLLLISVAPLVTPSVRDPEDSAGFSVTSVLEHTKRIADEPHAMGSEEIIEVRRYLTGELTALGIEVDQQPIVAPDYFGVPGQTVEVVNIMARVPGANPTKALLLIAHYDSVPTTPGANDNATAVGVLLEVGRILVERPPVSNDVILLLTDGEEPAPRFGSAAFVSDHPWMDDVGFVVNLEAAGGSGPSTVAEVSGPGLWVINGYAANAPNPTAYSFITEIIALVGDIGTDFDSFRDANMPGIHFAYMRGSPIYHTMEDSVDNVGVESAGHHGTNVLAVIDAFGDVDLADVPDSDRGVYFTVGRSYLVRYPVPMALPLGVVLVAVFGAVIILGGRRDRLHFRSIAMNSLAVIGGMLIAAVVATTVWWAIAGLRPSMGVPESYAYLIVLVALSGVVWVLVRRWRTSHRSRRDVVAAVVLVWFVFAALTTLWLPGTSYLFVWPVLGALLLLAAVGDRRRSPLARAGALILVATPVLILIVPAIDMFFQMGMPRPGNPGSEILPVVVGAVFLAYLGIALIDSAVALNGSE